MAVPRTVSRRGAITGLSVAGAGAAVAATLTPAQARWPVPSLADHPLTGSWLVLVTFEAGNTVAATSIAGADGSLLLVFPPSETGPSGEIRFRGPAVGAWEPVDDRTGHYTIVHVLSDTDGTYLGTMTLAGRSVVSDDGRTLDDVTADRMLTLRDPANAITAEVRGGSVRSLTGHRITPGHPGFPEEAGGVTWTG